MTNLYRVLKAACYGIYRTEIFSITIEVDENAGEVDPGSQDRRYSVHGVVTGVDGRELADAEVTVWRQRIRSRVRLVTGRTSEEGSYRLSYRPPPDDVPSKLLIIVEASSEHLASPLLSPLVEAQPDLQIDLHVEPSDQSELAKLLRGITPLLDRLELTDLVENDEHQDLSFLARELGKTSEEIMRVVVAARLEAAFDIPTAAFYAFLRQRVPSALPSPLLEASQNFTLIDSLVRRIGSLIFALSGDAEERTLVTAIALDLIGQQYAAQIPQIVSQLQTQRTTDLLNQPYLIGRAILSQLLGVVQLPQAKQQTFAHALATNTFRCATSGAPLVTASTVLPQRRRRRSSIPCLSVPLSKIICPSCRTCSRGLPTALTRPSPT
jgi:hypothetical protein